MTACCIRAPERWAAWIRFGGPGPLSPPDAKDAGILSLGIKLMGVPGEKLLDEDLDEAGLRVEHHRGSRFRGRWGDRRLPLSRRALDLRQNEGVFDRKSVREEIWPASAAQGL